MPGPIAHLLWGYVVSRAVTKRKDLILIGMAASVVMDVPFLFDLQDFHRTSTHYLAFPIFLSLLMLIFFRELKVFYVTFSNMLVHLILDTVATRGPVKWLYPLSDIGIGYSGPSFYPAFLVLRLFLILIPAFAILYLYIRKKEDPFSLLIYLVDRYIRKRSVNPIL
ncbi:MAG: metal-dependent hydrolase [Thermoplasmatota archaeon]